MVALEHFYYGQLVHHGAPKGEERVLARSKGVSDESIAIAQGLYRQVVLQDEARASWSLLRGNRDMPFLLFHAQQGEAGNTTQHVIILPSDVPRALQGNVGAYLALIPDKLPTFQMIADVMPVTFDVPEAFGTAEQSNYLLDLMTYTRNKTRNIEPLLSAIIHGRTLAVINAPADVTARLGFIQGLLMLLPSSTRFSVTFSLYTPASEMPNVQVAFVEGNVGDPKATLYDWETGKASNEMENDYSRFIISQLRLDAEHAVQQADSLTNTAGWRFKSGDTLAEALAYASHRSKIDKSVMNNLPVETKDVSQILSDDPTLGDEMRVAYASHLIKFSLALEDTSYTDPVALTCAKFPSLAKSVHQLFVDAIQNGKATLIFQTLARWLENPLAPQSPEWTDLLNRAALMDLRDIVQAKDTESLKDFIGELQNMQSAHLINRIVPKVIEVSVPLASEDAKLPSQILLLGMTYLDRAAFQKLMNVPNLIKYLPREIKRFLAALGAKDGELPSGILVEAAEQLGDDHKDEALMQFVDIAYSANRFPLIDTPTLAQMARISTTPRGSKYLGTVLNVARQTSDERIESLPEPAPRYVLQLFLASRRYDLLAKAMVEQSKNIYGGERQLDYVKMLQTMFASTRLSVPDLKKAIETLRDLYVKDVPLVCAMCGMLEASDFSVEFSDIANEATQQMTTNPRYAQVIHYEAPLALLKYHLTHNNDAKVKQVALIMPKVAENKEDRDSLMAIRETYRQLNAHEAYQGLAFEVLRHYARIANPKPAQRIVEHYSKELGNPYATKLQRAIEFSTFTNGLSLAEYANAVYVTANLLQNAHEAFLKERPKATELDALLENFRVRVDKIRRQKVAGELLKLIKAVSQLGKAMDSKHLAYEAVSAIAKGTEAPRNIVEIFRSAGGHLMKGKVVQIKLKQNTQPNPFGDMSPIEFHEQLIVANDVLRQPIKLFPSKVNWTAKNIADELASFVSMSYGEDIEAIAIDLGNDWQRLAELLPLMTKDADPTLADENSRNARALDNQQQLPRNAMELCRYLYGYLKE